MSWDNTVQRRVPMPPLRMETGRVTISGVSGQDFTVASKFSKVVSGVGVMEADGIIAFPATGQVSGGTVTWTRIGPIATSADVIQYQLFGW